jgi:NAD(P)-dependent dehydrogenase (short-subunit alcohol dehydrogenase family)
MPLERLSGRVAIVTGAASGIGQATATRFVREGASVFAIDITGDALDEAVAAVNLGAVAGGTAVAHVADVGDETAARTSVQAALDRFGKLDVLANIAGILRTAHSHECTLDMWDQILRVNLTGTFLMCRKAIPHLLSTRGSIVNTASTSSHFGHPWMAAYAASKGGVAALTQTLAIEYAKQGLRVNAVAPGSVTSGITTSITFPDGIDGGLIRRIMSPTGPGEPESVASVIALLASDDGAHMTGSIVRIDGGTHA